MNPLKCQIQQMEIKIEADKRLLENCIQDLRAHPQTPVLLSLVILGGLIAGYVAGRSSKVKLTAALPFIIRWASANLPT